MLNPSGSTWSIQMDQQSGFRWIHIHCGFLWIQVVDLAGSRCWIWRIPEVDPCISHLWILVDPSGGSLWILVDSSCGTSRILVDPCGGSQWIHVVETGISHLWILVQVVDHSGS